MLLIKHLLLSSFQGWRRLSLYEDMLLNSRLSLERAKHSVIVCLMSVLTLTEDLQSTSSQPSVPHVILSLHACWIVFVSVQGEKGEPGMVIGPDGSALSSLAGPAGPSGVKVIIPAFFSLFMDTFCSLSQNERLTVLPVSVPRVTTASPDLLDLQ